MIISVPYTVLRESPVARRSGFFGGCCRYGLDWGDTGAGKGAHVTSTGGTRMATWRAHRLRYACHVAQVYLDTPCSLRGTTATPGTCPTAVLQHVCVESLLASGLRTDAGCRTPFCIRVDALTCCLSACLHVCTGGCGSSTSITGQQLQHRALARGSKSGGSL